MNESLRAHLSQDNYNLPKTVVDEVCDMFKNEAANLLDSLSALKPEVRDVALHALRDYYSTMEKNNSTFTQVATVLAQPKINPVNHMTVNDRKDDAANNTTFVEAA